MSDRDTTRTLLDRLRRHYIKPGAFPGGVFVPECGINGGAQTRADALYVGFTSTSGRLLVGHEIKVSRADWRKELDTAGKADFWADNCHAWYIVAPSVEIVPPDELPHGWGLMLPSGRSVNRMEVKVKAQVHADRQPDWHATRSILARLDTLQAHQLQEIRQDAQDRAQETIDTRVEQRLAHAGRTSLTHDQQHRLHVLEQIENLLGERIDVWAEGTRIRPETAVAALRLAESTAAITGGRGHRSRYAEQELRDAAAGMLAGLDEFTAAMADLRSLLTKDET